VWVYTERTRFEWDIHLPGQRPRRGKYLLSKLGQLTRSTLEFSKVLADVVLPSRELRNCERKILVSGVYVPALYHMLNKYRVPSPLQFGKLRQNARLLAICGGYVEAALLGYPDGFWWQTLLNLVDELGVSPNSGTVPVSSSGKVHDCFFLFVRNGKRVGVIACDEAFGDQEWLDGTAKSAQALLERNRVESAVLMARFGNGTVPDFLPQTSVAMVVDHDSNRIAKKATAKITG
jgi:hypothetical protein